MNWHGFSGNGEGGGRIWRELRPARNGGLQRLERLERPFARLLEVDDRLGVALHAAIGPGLVDELVAELCDFGHPAADIVAGGIEALALGDGVEDAEIGRRVEA